MLANLRGVFAPEGPLSLTLEAAKGPLGVACDLVLLVGPIAVIVWAGLVHG